MYVYHKLKKSGVYPEDELFTIWSWALMCLLSQSKIAKLELPVCLSMWPLPETACWRQMDKLMLLQGLSSPQTQSSAAFHALHSHFQWHIFAKWLLCLVSVGTRAAPLAVDSAMVMAMARRISVQRNSMPARLSTPSQTHPWDQGATPLLWLVKYCTGL